MRHLLVALFALTLIAAGCGGHGDDAMPVEPEGGIGGSDQPPQPGDGISVGELLDRGITGPVTVEGFIVIEDDDVRLCDALAESFPPQCGGDFAPLVGLEAAEVPDLQTEGRTSWTDLPVTLIGELVDDAIVVIEIIG